MKEKVLEAAIFASAASELEEMIKRNPEDYPVDLETFQVVRRYYYRELLKRLVEYARSKGLVVR